MTEHESEGPERDMDELAADLAMDAKESYEVQKQKQNELLESVREGKDAEYLETKCNIVGDIVVPIKAKLNGELIDKMGDIQHRIENYDKDGEVYQIGRAADEVCQLIADSIDDPEWDKETFYVVYKEEGLEPLGDIIAEVFSSLKKERERRHGTAEGFRPAQSEGS